MSSSRVQTGLCIFYLLLVVLHNAHAQSSVCPQDGIKIPDVSDCTRYYECVSGVPIGRQCPQSLNYNCVQETCTVDVFTPCCQNDTSKPLVSNTMCLILGMKLPSSLDCDKYFECSGYRMVESSCPPGQSYDWLWKKCRDTMDCSCAPGSDTDMTTTLPSTTVAEDACDQDGTRIPDDSDCRKYLECENQHWQSRVCPPGTVFQCFHQTCTPLGLHHCCPNDLSGPRKDDYNCFLNGLKVPYPLQCNKYFECQNYQIILNTCPDGQSYDWSLGGCITVPKEKCARSYRTATAASLTSTTTTPLIEICPSDGLKLPDDSSCNGYFECLEGLPQLRICPNNSVFNCLTQSCTPNGPSQCCQNSYKTRDECRIDGLKAPFGPSCDKYLECVNGSVKLMDCPSGLKYDWLRNECVDHAMCRCVPHLRSNITPIGNGITGSTPSPPMCDDEDLKLPDVNDCQSYFECENGTVARRQCPEGLFWNCWIEMCTSNIVDNCCKSDTSEDLEIVCFVPSLKMPDPIDCSAYFECDNWITKKKHCPSGQQFDFWSLSCRSSNITCAQNVTYY